MSRASSGPSCLSSRSRQRSGRRRPCRAPWSGAPGLRAVRRMAAISSRIDVGRRVSAVAWRRGAWVLWVVLAGMVRVEWREGVEGGSSFGRERGARRERPGAKVSRGMRQGLGVGEGDLGVGLGDEIAGLGAGAPDGRWRRGKTWRRRSVRAAAGWRQTEGSDSAGLGAPAVVEANKPPSGFSAGPRGGCGRGRRPSGTFDGDGKGEKKGSAAIRAAAPAAHAAVAEGFGGCLGPAPPGGERGLAESVQVGLSPGGRGAGRSRCRFQGRPESQRGCGAWSRRSARPLSGLQQVVSVSGWRSGASVADGPEG